MKNDSILILGTGALATLFAARLAAEGSDVIMLGSWPEGLRALKDKGIRVDGIDRVFQVRVTANPADCKDISLALVLVKSWQTQQAAQQLALCLADDGLALTLQNGLGNNTILAQNLGASRVAQGVTTLGAYLLAPGFVRPGGEGVVSLEIHPRLNSLEKILIRSGFDVNVVENVLSLVWGKLVVNSAINPLTAILQVRNGKLLENPYLRGLMRDLAVETAEVAKNIGVALPFSDPNLAVIEVAEKTAENLSSMLQDVLRCAPTEIDAINGAIIKIAQESNTNVPVNHTIYSLMKAIIVRGKIGI
jgi:2-dehydropantoate 2-reductase